MCLAEYDASIYITRGAPFYYLVIWESTILD